MIVGGPTSRGFAALGLVPTVIASARSVWSLRVDAGWCAKKRAPPRGGGGARWRNPLSVTAAQFLMPHVSSSMAVVTDFGRSIG